MPLEVGPGYVSPSLGSYSPPPGTSVSGPGVPAVIPTVPAYRPSGDAWNTGGPIMASAGTGGAIPPLPGGGGVYQVKSFFSNLWDQLLGPLFKGVWGMFAGLFGRK